MSHSVAIRQFRPEDADALVEIALAAWAPLFDSWRKLMGENLFAALHANWRDDKANAISCACEGEDGARVAVAERDHGVVGFVTFYGRAHTGMGAIGNNAVHPDFQGMGIGTMMYEYVFEQLRESGVRFVEVRTGGDAFHARARRAYEKAGFSIQCPEVTYYKDLSNTSGKGARDESS